jgi:hypothetical protein
MSVHCWTGKEAIVAYCAELLTRYLGKLVTDMISMSVNRCIHTPIPRDVTDASILKK